ncbi:MAG: serine protease, partial [Actinomycetota bacterium]
MADALRAGPSRRVAAVTARLVLPCVALAAGCATDDDPPPLGAGTVVTSETTDTATSATDTATSATAAGVGIRAEGCGAIPAIGSGVVVEQRGRVATVAHTIAGAVRIEVIDAEGARHDAAVLAFDPDRDLAVLDVPTLDAVPLPLGQGALGSADVLRWRPVDGVTSSTAEITRRLGITIADIFGDGSTRRTGLELEATITGGDSGGAVIDASGAVVGIVYADSRTRA